MEQAQPQDLHNHLINEPQMARVFYRGLLGFNRLQKEMAQGPVT